MGEIEPGLGRAFDEFFFKINELFHVLCEVVPETAYRASQLRQQDRLAGAFKIEPEHKDEFEQLWRKAFGEDGLEAMLALRESGVGAPGDDELPTEEETDESAPSQGDEQMEDPSPRAGIADHAARPQPEAAAAGVRSSEVVDFIARHGSTIALTDSMRAYTRLSSQIHTLANSTIVMAVGALETAIGQAERSRLREHRGAIRADEKEFSLAELMELGDIDSVVERAIDKRVENLCYAGPDGWAQWADRSLSIDMKSLSPDWDALREVVQRRHLIAHNNGRVSRLYIERTGREDVEIDQDLDTGPDYVFGALDQIAVLGLAFLVHAWCRLGDDIDHVLSHLSSRTYDALTSGHWAAARLLATESFERSEPASFTNLVGRVNVWLAKKSAGDDISEEVRTWDTSGLSTVFQVAWASLLGDIDEVVRLMPMAIRGDEVHRSDLLSWPLLAGLREDDRFADVLALADATGVNAHTGS